MIKFESEACLEKFIMDNLDDEKIKKILHIDDIDKESKWITKNQVNLKSYGIADIISFKYSTWEIEDLDGDEELPEDFTVASVVELKNNPLICKDIIQLSRYMKAMSACCDCVHRGILIGPSIEVDDWVHLIDLIPNVDVYTFSIDPKNGIVFNKTNKFISTGQLPNSEYIESIFKES